MRVHLVNPSDVSFGISLVAPRWLYVLAGATPSSYGVPNIVDEGLESLDLNGVQKGDVVGIGIHTSNARRGYQVGQKARERGAFVVFGGIHASLFPEEASELGGAHAVVKGDGDVIWAEVLADCSNGGPQKLYEGGRVEGDQFTPARWDLLPLDRYMWASVQTVRGCPKHCSFCSVWRTDGQTPREHSVDGIIRELVELRRKGFRFIVLADDNFYPVTLQDVKTAEGLENPRRLEELQAMRQERFDLMERLSELPEDMVFFTQITMEVADDPEFLKAMSAARIKGALVGVESVTEEGLKEIYKDFNSSGESLVRQLKSFREHGVYVLGSFIFGLSSDRPETFDATTKLAQEAELAFAQFVTLTPFPGTVDFQRWEKKMADDTTRIAGFPLTRYWLMPRAERPRLAISHPVMSGEEIRSQTQQVWDHFYSLPLVWKRSDFFISLRSRLAYVLMSKLYRQMYANTGIATDSARINRAVTWARWMAKPTLRLFHGQPMPELQVPGRVQ
ncbi:MAG: radical SAM protein [Acidobacteriota bacterium]